MKPPTSHRKLFALALTGLAIAGASSASAATTAYRNLILGDSPIAYYELDETTGTNAANSATTGAAQDAAHTGALNLGQASAATFLGTSYDFVGGYAVAAAIPNSLTEWTLEAWVNYSSDKTSDSHIVANDQGGWNDDLFFGINPEGGLLGAVDAWDLALVETSSAKDLRVVRRWPLVSAPEPPRPSAEELRVARLARLT